jgi:hypothetical protein
MNKLPKRSLAVIFFFKALYALLISPIFLQTRSLLAYDLIAMVYNTGPTAGMVLVRHADANRHVLLNTRKLNVYPTCRLCQQTQTLNLLVVVQG